MGMLDYMAMACKRGDIDSVSEFLSLGANPDMFGRRAKENGDYYQYDYYPVIVIAAKYGHAKVVQLLAEAGADLNAKTTDGLGKTALIFAAERGDTGTADFLMDSGANVDLQDDGGSTALHVAARLNRRSILNSLIARGANLKIKTKSGITPYSYAASNSNINAMWELGRRKGSSLSVNKVEREMIRRINENWNDLRHIKDPSPAIIAAAMLRSDGQAAKYIN